MCVLSASLSTVILLCFSGKVLFQPAYSEKALQFVIVRGVLYSACLGSNTVQSIFSWLSGKLVVLLYKHRDFMGLGFF